MQITQGGNDDEDDDGRQDTPIVNSEGGYSGFKEHL